MTTQALQEGSGSAARGAPVSAPIHADQGPSRFLLHYVRRRLGSHLAVLLAVLAAVGCAVGSQYGVKNLVDALGSGGANSQSLWSAVGLLLALVAGDNLLWRLAGWISTRAFVLVGGDLRIDLFQHLSRHGSGYFSDHFPGALAGRITTAATAAFSPDNSLTCIAMVIGAMIWRCAAGSRHLHDRFAARAAVVTGDLTDVISNIGLVRSFAAADRERQRLSGRIQHEMSAQRESLRSLERLRLFHACCVFAVTAGLLIWSVLLWRAGRITTGDVVLATT